ncbi:8-amino-7-oxononanoate synthase [Natronosporangium hydrolyticum]|uniref:8-amino-7-oxononanoate synthase n=1 Tax=Natronosporangium hydrolyticum TaxID=2811111 RepID=A0A895YEA3_9ACTN|nr:8-amino-7-oxononanoate synthase [Natronosporangium hydrolyticum]QSB12866.1 8-amino-7-oxononanoate synthase [Natronosporangium hydrolyticum]
MTIWLQRLERRATLRARAGLTRHLRPRRSAEEVIDLAGNDYLGLSRHPEVVAAAIDGLTGYGLGATGSRLVRGTTELHTALEADLAGWLGAEQALVYSSGYLANLGALTALAQPKAVFILDQHAHASLVDGCRLAGAETVVTPHCDLAAVVTALAEAAGRPTVVVTESVFSVDGDAAPLSALHQAAREHGALLLIDDAHGLGVLGPAGAGGAAAAGLAGERDVVVTATLSKALGAAGGVVAGPAAWIRHLIETGRTFIYDTALAPPVVAGARTALRLARKDDARRDELRQRAGHAAERLRGAGLPTTVPAAGVVSVEAADAESASAWAAACRERGVSVGCFRPPSTPDHRSRLRLTVNASLSAAEFDAALDVIVACAP